MLHFKTMTSADFGPACDTAINKQDRQVISDLSEELHNRISNKPSTKLLSFYNYLLGNLYSCWSRIEQETADGWRTQSYPLFKVKSIDHFRECMKLDSSHNLGYYKEALTNLGNELSQQCRGIEALFYWKPDFSSEGDAPFISALSRSQFLIWVSHWLNDPSHRSLFAFEAYLQLKELESHIENTTHPYVRSALKDKSELREFMSSGDNQFQSLLDWQDKVKKSEDKSEETLYRKWCFSKNLFANPVNLLTESWVANQDILQFPN